MTQSRTRIRTLALLAAGIPAMAAGCESATTGDYLGEELATISGSVTGNPDAEPTSPSAALVWAVPAEEAIAHLVAESVEVASAFPAGFSFHLYEPPPADALWAPDSWGEDAGGMEFAIGSFVAFDDKNGDGEVAVNFDESGIESPDEIIGVAERDFALFIAVPPATPVAGLPADIEPGYYIMHFPCADMDCEPVIHEDDFDVSVSLTTPSSSFPGNFPFIDGEGSSGGGGESDDGASSGGGSGDDGDGSSGGGQG